jgi:hypothetical protein
MSPPFQGSGLNLDLIGSSSLSVDTQGDVMAGREMRQRNGLAASANFIGSWIKQSWRLPA